MPVERRAAPAALRRRPGDGSAGDRVIMILITPLVRARFDIQRGHDGRAVLMPRRPHAAAEAVSGRNRGG